MPTFTAYAKRTSTIIERGQFEVEAATQEEADALAAAYLLENEKKLAWIEMDPTEAKGGEPELERVTIHAYADPEDLVVEE